MVLFFILKCDMCHILFIFVIGLKYFNECTNYSCVMKSMNTLKECQVEVLSNNHAVVSFKKGDSIIKEGMFSTNIVFSKKRNSKNTCCGTYSSSYHQMNKVTNIFSTSYNFREQNSSIFYHCRRRMRSLLYRHENLQDDD